MRWICSSRPPSSAERRPMRGIMVKCVFCGLDAREAPRMGDYREIECRACTTYKLGGSAEQLLKNRPFDPQELAIASGWLRENPGTSITTDIVEKLRNMGRPDPTEKSIKLLAYIAGQTKTPGQPVSIHLDDRVVLSSAWLVDRTELEWQ